MNGKSDTFGWPEPPLHGGILRPTSSLHNVSEASEPQDRVLNSPPLYRIQLSPSKAERKRATEGNGRVGEIKVPKNAVSVSDLVARLHKGPNESQVLLAVKSNRQKMGFLPQPPPGRQQAPVTSYQSVTLWADMSQHNQKTQAIQSVPLNLFPKRNQAKLPPLTKPASPMLTPDVDTGLSSSNDLKSDPEITMDDLLPSEKRGISFREPGNDSVMAAQSSGDQAQPLSLTPTMFSPSLSDPPPGSREKKQSGRKGSVSPSSLPRSRMKLMRKSTYDDLVPTNRNFLEVLTAMRSKLGWSTTLPDMGAAGHASMATLKDMPDPAKNMEAALNAQPDDGYFVYLLPRHRGPGCTRTNPYDLEVVSANEARQSAIYYTASASNVTQLRPGGDSEEAMTTPVMQWLWERRLFNKIFVLPVFSRFRIWKSFTIWKNNTRRHKNTGTRVVLHRTLFKSNEVLLGCLLHIRSLCETASSSSDGLGRGESGVSLIRVDSSVTWTLTEFLDAQRLQRETALKQLTALWDTVIDIVWQACVTVAELEGVTVGIHPETTEEESSKVEGTKTTTKKKMKGPPEVLYSINSKYGKIPVYKTEEEPSSKPTYAQITEWRKILNRLSYFLKLIDYVMLELLRRLVVTATSRLLTFVNNSFTIGLSLDDDSDDESVSSSESFTSRKTVTFSPMPGRQTVSKQTTHSMTSSMSSSLAQRKLSSHKVDTKKDRPAYIPPEFDFDKVESVHESIDIDELLEEINQGSRVVQTPESVLSVQLVLSLPKVVEVKHRHPRHSKLNLSAAPKISIDKRALQEGTASTTDETKKAVTFIEPEYDSDNTDGEESDESSDEMEQEDLEGGNRFNFNEDSRQSEVLRRKSSVPNITTSSIVLSPTVDEMRSGFRDTIWQFEETVSQMTSMLEAPRLKVFYSPPSFGLKLNCDAEAAKEDEEDVPSWPDTGQLFGEDDDYQLVISDLMSCINNSIDMVLEYSQEFNQYCKMVDQASLIDVEASMLRKQWSTDEFQHVLTVQTEQVKEMRAMRRVKRVGLMEVHTQQFCDTCLPYPENIISIISRRLPEIAFKKNLDLLTIIKGATRKLDHLPESVEEFVDHLSFLGKIGSEMAALNKEYNIVIKLYTIAKDFELTLVPEEYALYQTLSPSFQHLKTVILYAEAKKEDNIRKFSQSLDRLIREIKLNIGTMKNRVSDPLLLSGDTMAIVALEKIKLLIEEVSVLLTKGKSYANYQERFGSSGSHMKHGLGDEYLMVERQDEGSAQEIGADLSELERDLTLRRLLWESQEEWETLSLEWLSCPFDSLSVEHLQKHVNRFSQTIYMLEKGLPSNEVVPRLNEKVMSFKLVMPGITSLRNPYLKARHWEEIEKLIGRAIDRDKTFTLGNLLEMNLTKHKDKIQDISTMASNEATLERMLQKVIDVWQNTDFRLVPHSSGNVQIIAGADDILTQLEESQVTIGTIRGSRYVTPIKGIVEDWERKLALFGRTLEEWMTCQRNWLYLEQIFCTPDIQRQLPTESKLFGAVDKAWKEIMRKTTDKPNALRAATASGVLEMLQVANTNLEKIQKCLEDYLETKRLVFPRFYFLSNDELLDILSQSKNPDAVQPHLDKCFGNIKSLDIKTLPHQPPTVKTMISSEGEVIVMPKNVRARGPVEQWLGSVESGMFDIVKKHLKLGLQDWSSTGLDNWVLKHPGQVTLTVAQIMFNKDVLACFAGDDPMTMLIDMRDKVIGMLNMLAGLMSANLVMYKRLSINALLTIDVHNRDIIFDMIENKISQKDDFEWTRQLRYEWDERSNNCNVLQSNATFHYGYEYLGCSPRLVITPLTDRCYLTLCGALHLHLGGSPAGPAGTGKTETVKDLAKAMGKQCVVFNCSEGLDFKMLAKFFSGLAQSGSWCCFDEFNRIDIEVLSVVAQQIHTIKTAKDQMVMRFMFEGREIKLNMSCGFFITMNPSYAGRVELPDNLKSLFRPVAMMVPDYALIAEIILFSEGFTAAKSLSTKLVNLYQLASKQLSQQDHYDFGMRAIKSVLVMAGQKKRYIQMREPSRVIDEEEESYILIHSLQDANMPKFLSEDVPLFESIMADLFPGIKPPQQNYSTLEKAISMAVRDLGLQYWPQQVEKVRQLYNQVMVRHGVMLVGPTGGGKTTTRNILQRALVLLPMILNDEEKRRASKADKRRSSTFIPRSKKGRVETFTLNPKCIKLGELYGETDMNTYEWTDGLIAIATRKFSREHAASMAPVEDTTPGSAASSHSNVASPKHDTPEAPSPSSSFTAPESVTSLVESSSSIMQQAVILDGSIDTVLTDWQWIILDGPVDTLWVENLNTVLDDSKVLCLANGERIALTPGMRLMFEVDDLSQASPATISRCAMVYMDPVDLGWRPYVKTWLQRLPKEMPESAREHLLGLFELSVDKGMTFIRQNRKYLMLDTPELSLVMCLCSLLQAFFQFMQLNGGFGSADVEPRPGSAESESGHSRCSSSKAERRRKRAAKKQRAKDTHLLPGDKSKKRQSEKQFFLQRNPGALPILLGKLFVFAFTWSYGGNLKRNDEPEDDGGFVRQGSEKMVDIASEFDNFIRELFEVEPPYGVRLPASSRSIYGYFVDMDTGNFLQWDILVPTTQSLIEKGAMITIGETMGLAGEQAQQGGKGTRDGDIVPTVDTVRYSFLAGLLLTNKNSVLLTGDSGVGKTVILESLLKQLGQEGGSTTKSGTVLGRVFHPADKNQALLSNISTLTKFGTDDGEGEKDMSMLLAGSSRLRQTGVISATLQFSAQTTADRTKLAITQRLVKKGKDVLGAPKGKKVIVFLDDLNMPALEQYGAQPPLELLRQFMELSGFYDTHKLAWKEIHDVTIVGACAPPGGGRNVMSPRLLKHFCMLALPQPSSKSLQHIYQVVLGRFFQEGEYMPEVKDSLYPLIAAAIAIYYRMCANMRPTPAKIHYTFNIRDLSKVITGLLQADETVIVNSTNCAQLFAHEATRVFHDRLVDKQERILFYKMLSDNLHDYFKVRWDADMLMSDPVLFADFLDLETTLTRRIYRPVTDPTKLRQTLEEFHMRLNVSNTAAPMVFFREAIEHILRAARVFRQPGGHILMVGLDGTGKSSVVKLAAYIVSCDLYKLTLTRGYGISDFEDDIKKVFLQAGVKGHNTVFLITDADIVNESFLEDVNSILNSGEVPDLFDNEEIDGIAMDLEAAAVLAQVPGTRTAIYQFFVQRVKKNLHIVLAMSPAGSKFRQRCRMNPSLINCCTIDWFNEWDREAMLAVAHVYFQNADFICDDNLSLEALKDNVAQICVDMHDTVAKATTRFWDEVKRHYYVTPSSYMELILIYSRMLKDQKTEFMTNRTRLQVGLSRLSEANDMVGTMQHELVTLGPRIEEKAVDTEVLLRQLEKDQEAVDQVREIVLSEEAVMKRETEIVQEYADACQADLASVIPSLHAAITSLDSLDKADISEIRVYAHPPALVIMVMAAVCVLLEEKTSWATAKQVLGDPQFLKKLVGLDKNAVPERVYTKLKRYTKHPEFTPEKVGQVSVACKSMCQWVLALENYHEVYKMAKPKQRKVKEAKEALAMAQSHLAHKQMSLAKIQAHFEMLQRQYMDSVNQRESLKEHKALTALRLDRASILIEALSNEKVRWEESVHLLDFKLKGLVGNTLVSAGMVAYVGPFTSGYRQELAADWLARCHEKAIPISDDYEFVRNLVDANQILRWNNEGLPNDSNSTQNAIIMKKARKWPLLIDPQCQASQWIQQMEGQQLKCVNASDSNYLHSIERAIRIGEAVLLQEVTEDLDPSLKPILLQNTFVKGGHTLIKIGDTEIEYNSNFRLYLATSLSNPHYLPAICIQVTLINFTVTFNALQEQLLSSVVKQEQPQLEHDRSHLLQLIANDQMVLRDLEDKSLSLLQKSQGHILDDHVLVETLQASKGMSEEMHERVQTSRLTEQKLSAARKKYLPVATRGAVLYFVLADLATVDVMYQFSLTWFYEMFSSCIDLMQSCHAKVSSRHSSFSHSTSLRPAPGRPKAGEATQGEDLTAQLEKMITRLTTSVYKIVSVALFAHHQLMFSFMLCTSIMRSNAYATTSHEPVDGATGNDTISQLEWLLFLQGHIMAGMLDDDTCKQHDGLSHDQVIECQDKDTAPPTRPAWISDIMWRQCQNLEAKFDSFNHLCPSIVNSPNQWTTLVQSHDPYHLMLTPYKPTQEEGVSKYAVVFPWQQLSSIQRLILVHILCPATLTAAIRHFVFDHMGASFLSSGTADLQEMYEESSAKTPFIFILSPGSDPAAQLLRFAKELRGSTLHLDIISLGRGQGPRAEELILKAQILKGRWIFLQNCHLAASWMPRLQAIVDGFNKPDSDVDPQFRLWLSSKPDPSFPVSILQMGLKMTVEPPQGLKANLLRSFGGGGSGAITQKLYEESCAEHPEWRTLLFGLCFFNAVIHERKKYGRLGWNIPYEFSDSDLEVSVLQLEMLLEEQEAIPWPALWYLTGEVTYGGRVTDDMDRRCLHSLLQKFYHPNILQHGYYYSNDKLYHPLPQGFSFTEAKVYIETLPAQDDPEVFGMNENAEKAYLVSQAGTFIETILGVQPRIMKGLIGDGRSSDQIALEIAADMSRSLPTEVDIYDEEVCAALKTLHPLSLADVAKIGMSTDMVFAKTKYKEPTQSKKEKGSSEDAEQSLEVAVDKIRSINRSALFTVLRQEIDRFNNLLSVIHQSLKSLQLAIKGEVVMSEKLDEAYNAILKQQVPAHWRQFAYESCKPLAQWVSDLVQRVTFFSGWAKLVTAASEKALRSQLIGTYLQRLQMSRSSSDQESAAGRAWHTQPSSFWLSGFFFPQGFLTAVLQNHARKLGISVDSLTFEFAVMNNPSDTNDSLNDIQRKLDIKQLAFMDQTPPINGVLVFGLYIDGARWDVGARALSDALPGNRFSQLPRVHFIPNANLSRTTSTNFESPLAMFKSSEHVSEDKRTYECPLYRTSSRAGTLSSTGMSTNFITTVSLPSDHVPEFWVMRGVALLCQLDI